MKVCVCSDSHGNKDDIKRMLELEKPDGLLFCGDGVTDFRGLKLPEKTLMVKGNCDFFCDEPEERDFSWEGVRILMAHGHRYGVKGSDRGYLSEALARDAKVAIYGHSHYQTASYEAGVLLLNPGTMSQHNGYYAILTIDNGVADCELKRLMPYIGI